LFEVSNRANELDVYGIKQIKFLMQTLTLKHCLYMDIFQDVPARQAMELVPRTLKKGWHSMH